MVAEVIKSIKPLMIKVNKPSDKMLKGNVSISSNGLMIALIIPRNIEPTIAPHIVNSKPGMM
jgi:hypothetical protein